MISDAIQYLNQSRVFGTALRLRLFVISYVPLFVMFGFRSLPKEINMPPDWQTAVEHHVALMVWVVLALIGVLDALWLVHRTCKRSERPLFVSELRDQGSAASGYLATYLLPLLGVAPHDWREWGAYGVYFIVAGVVFVRSELGLVNPTLYLLGWKAISGTRTHSKTGSRQEIFVLCRREAHPVSTLDESGRETLYLVESAGLYVLKPDGLSDSARSEGEYEETNDDSRQQAVLGEAPPAW